jgi:hypothetical protein
MTSSLERPILDLRFHKDPRSRSYRARDEVARTARFKRVWTTRKAGPLDQGREGECVGFACAGELAAKPAAFTVTDETGRKIFAAARSIDLSEGRDFPDGATVIAGLQACRRANYFLKFLWCFGIDDTINWIVRRGPVILGIPWYDGMYDPDTRGLLRVVVSLSVVMRLWRTAFGLLILSLAMYWYLLIVGVRLGVLTVGLIFLLRMLYVFLVRTGKLPRRLITRHELSEVEVKNVNIRPGYSDSEARHRLQH